jgi:hypothetical protein
VVADIFGALLPSVTTIIIMATLLKGTRSGRTYAVEQLDAPLPPERSGAILRLLDGFGTHFAQWFGNDLAVRLAGEAGVTTFIASLNRGEDAAAAAAAAAAAGPQQPAESARPPQEEEEAWTPVAQSSVYMDLASPAVGALFNVFTAVEYRDDGLSRDLVRRTLEFFDKSGGQLMVLGTGSPYAARTCVRARVCALL